MVRPIRWGRRSERARTYECSPSKFIGLTNDFQWGIFYVIILCYNRSGCRKYGRFGLFSIRERLEPIGGHVEVASKPGQGTKVTLMGPLKSDGENERRKVS